MGLFQEGKADFEGGTKEFLKSRNQRRNHCLKKRVSYDLMFIMIENLLRERGFRVDKIIVADYIAVGLTV